MQAIETQDKQFHDGNGTTELGTILPAWWLNQVQSELLGVLTAANIAPNKAKTNQLAEAIQKLFPNKNFTLTTGAGLTGGGDLSVNRTIGLATPSTLSGSTTNWVGNGATGHTHEIAKATLTLAGVVQLSSAVNNDSEATAATSKAVKQAFDRAVEAKNTADGKANTRHTHAIADITGLQAALNSKLEANQLSSASTSRAGVVQLSSEVNSDSEATAATSKAVKQAFDRAVEAEGKGLPVGAIVAFPWGVNNPEGYLLCNGSAFSRETYADLYRVLGNRDRVPHLSRSDIGQTAYFPVDAIPSGWIAFDDIERLVTRSAYRELYDLLVAKYGSIAAVPKAADRYIRGNGNGLEVGTAQEDAIRNIVGYFGSSKMSYHNGLQIFDDAVTEGAFGIEPKQWRAWTSDSGQGGNAVTGINFDASRVVPTADENRPKTIVFKLCIKALNTFTGAVFWIKAFGRVNNEGSLNAAGLAGDLQALRTELDTAKNEINRLKARPATPTDNTPSGTIAYFAGNTAPQGWLKANGAAVSRTTYANLFRVIGTTYGAGSNSSTFNLPDLRGEFIRGFDDGRNVDAGRTLGSAQLDAIQEHAHSLQGGVGRSISGALISGVGGGAGALADSSARTAETPTIGNPTNARTASETRPRNIALLACIKI